MIDEVLFSRNDSMKREFLKFVNKKILILRLTEPFNQISNIHYLINPRKDLDLQIYRAWRL
jgi:hypothetical protein